MNNIKNVLSPLKSLKYENTYLQIIQQRKMIKHIDMGRLLGAAARQVYLKYTFLEQFIVTHFPVSVW